MHEKNEGKFLIQTHSQAKMSGTTLPEVHGVRKKLDPNEARKAACLTQKRSNRKATYRSGQSRIEKKA